MKTLRKFLSVVLITAMSLTLLVGCEPKEHTDVSQNTENPGEITRGLSQDVFDLSFSQFMEKETKGNYMVSPLSFKYALALLLGGAKGETEAELLKAFGVKTAEEFTQKMLKFNGFMARFEEGLKKDIKDHKDAVENGWASPDTPEPFRALKVANSVWRRSDFPELKSEYNDFVRKNFSADSFTFTPDNVVKRVNEWANEKTESMIPELLDESYDVSDLAVILMNALYFKDSWVYRFSVENSYQDDFFTLGGETVEKTYMKEQMDVLYYGDEETELVVLPMDGDVNMTFVLGSQENLGEKVKKATVRPVIVNIPKTEVESSFTGGELVRFLKSVGVEKIFTDEADFSKMSDRPIAVSDIIQKTKLKLDETGCEAAALTAILMYETAMPEEPKEPVEFKANKPFSMYLHTELDGEAVVLLQGRIVE